MEDNIGALIYKESQLRKVEAAAAAAALAAEKVENNSSMTLIELRLGKDLLRVVVTSTTHLRLYKGRPLPKLENGR